MHQVSNDIRTTQDPRIFLDCRTTVVRQIDVILMGQSHIFCPRLIVGKRPIISYAAALIIDMNFKIKFVGDVFDIIRRG